MIRRLEGRTALITGAARGIGLAFAKAYLAEGARVVLADIDADRARSEAENLGPCAMVVELDVTSQESIDSALAKAFERFGEIDILINNAAVFTASPVLDVDRKIFQSTFAVNVEGTFFMLQSVARRMVAAGVKGHIINMASQAGRRGEALVSVYCATKAAVISLTQSAGLDLIKHGINVNAIAPGVVDGEHWDEVDAYFAKYEGKRRGQKKAEVGASVPYGRMGIAEDLTGMAVFLASEDARYVVAQTYNVDGGNWMS